MFIRIRVLTIFFILAFLTVAARLFYWQVYKGKELSVKARDQHQTGATISAPRGNILASDGTWLVASTEAWLVYASLPDLKASSSEIAGKLAPFFLREEDSGADFHDGLLQEESRLKGLLEKSGVVWIPLKQKVSTQVKNNIEALGISGIGFEEQQARFYPEASSAAHLLGFVGKNSDGENVGYFGLEGYYDLPLSGKPGYYSREADAKGVPLLLGDSKEILAINGVDLDTYIDKAVQLELDKKLQEGIEKYQASAGEAIVMDPASGAILAMSAFPSYDPANYSEFGDEYFKDPTVSSSFEPGSVFKVVVMASALDAGVVTPDTVCDTCSGPVKVDNYYIETWNKVYNPGSTMLDVIVHSDNVGMVFVANRLGTDRLYDYLHSFGIGALTGIDLQGEATPKLRDRGSWNGIDLATAGFGQGVALTPIQLIRAVAAIANKGIMVTPRVVERIAADGLSQEIVPGAGQRVISEKAAAETTAMMYEAAKSGEAKWTYLKGFKVAGKTGTAQIPIAGHYDPEKTMASFIGFAPYDKPKFIMLVILREPQSSQWASETAAPLWYSIAKDLFPYFGIQPE